MAKSVDDVALTSRRRLLKGMGILSGALAVAGGCPVHAAAEGDSFSPGALSPNARQESQPFYGRHQGRDRHPAAGVDDAGGLRRAGDG